jgi:dephospho-CoA kinase
MIRIALVGDIGSGKTYIANLFNYPVFNADKEVSDIYKKNMKCFQQIKKKIPNFFNSFPLKKEELIEAILSNKINIKKISKIVHPIVRKRMFNFISKNRNKKFIILDVPLFLENKLNNKNDIIIYVQSKKIEINKRLKKRKNYNSSIFKKLKDVQFPLSIKKKKSNFIIKNDFKNKSVKKNIKNILQTLSQ